MGWSAASWTRPSDDEAEYQAKTRKYDLEEREIGVRKLRFKFFREKVYFALSVLLILGAVASYWLGVPQKVTLLTGGSSVAAGAASFWSRRPTDVDDRP